MGYDAGRFLQPPGDSLSCPVCKNVLCDPVTICSDGDVVCSSCSPTSRSCPIDTCSAPVNPPSNREANITLRTKVNRLMIRCAGAPLGCSWEGLLKDEPAHVKECAFQLSPCPYEGCKKKVPPSSLEVHRAECPMRVAPCANAPRCTFKEAFAKHESHRLICNRYRCRQQPHGCHFVGTLAALQGHQGFCNATWDELTYLRAQANVAPQVSSHPPVNATILAPRARAPQPERQATLLTPTSSLAEHRREENSSQSSSALASEAPPDITISKSAPEHSPRDVLVLTSRASITSISAEEQPTVQARDVKDPTSAPSRSSSVSLEGLLAEREGDSEGQHHQAEAAGVEELQLSVSPWVDSPSPIAQRLTEKRKSPPLKEGNCEKGVQKGSNGPPKKRQRVEMAQVTNNGRPEDRGRGAAVSIPVDTGHPPSNHTPSQPNTKRPRNGSNRGGRGRGGPGHRTQDRKYQNGYGQYNHLIPGPQFYPFGYPGPPQNQPSHLPVNPPMAYNPQYQQGYRHPPQTHPFNQNLSAVQPVANQSQNSGTPWQGFEWEALKGPYHPFSRERYSQSFPQVDTFPYPHHPISINRVRDQSPSEVPPRQSGLDNLYEDDVNLDYMDYDLRESNPDPRGLPHHRTNTGTRTQAMRPQTKHITPLVSRDIASAKSPPSFNRLSASAGAARFISLKTPPTKPRQQPIDRVMVLQQRPDALHLLSRGPSTTPNNNNSLYNRQLDFTPSLLSHPPAQYVLDATFWKIEARDAARKADAILAKQTTNDPKAPLVLPVAFTKQLGRIREKGPKENGGSQKTPRQAGFPKWPQPTTEDKRLRPSKSVATAVEPSVNASVNAKVTSEKVSCSKRNSLPPTQVGEATPASYGDVTSSDDNILPGGVEVADGFKVIDTEVHESEKWGGGRLIPSGLKVARCKGEGVGLGAAKLSSRRVSDKPSEPTVDGAENTDSDRPQPEDMRKLTLPCTTGPTTTLPLPQKSTNVPSTAMKSFAKGGLPRCGRPPGVRGHWKGYVLTQGRPTTSKGKLLLLDAPPALLPQRSTRSGKVFKPPEGGSSSDHASEDNSSEEEKRVIRRRRLRGAARKHILVSEHSDKSSSPDVPWINAKKPAAAPHSKSDSPLERTQDVKYGTQEHIQREMTPFTSSASPFPLTDPLRPVLTSLDPSKTPRPSHAAKRPPRVGSTQSSRESSPSPRAKARHSRPRLRRGGGKQPAGKLRRRESSRGSKHPVSLTVGHKDQSPSFDCTNSMDVEESTKTPDDGTEPHKQTTRESSAGTGGGSRRSSPRASVRERSKHTPSLSSVITSPQDSIVPDPTTLVSQLNLKSSNPPQQFSLNVAPNLGIDPLSMAFESHPYLSGMEDPGSGIKFLGEIEQVLDGHFLESLTHGLYGASTSSCLDSDLTPM